MARTKTTQPSTALFPKYTLHLWRRYPEYKVSARQSVMLKSDDLEELLIRAGNILKKPRSPWAGYSFAKYEDQFVNLATFTIE